jgi:dCTP deaminase
VSVLVDCEILREHKRGAIIIDPFDRKCLGTNSYDVHLSNVLRVYEPEMISLPDPPGVHYVGGRLEPAPLDVRKPCPTIDVRIPDEGYVLLPHELYLASTIEYTESNAHLPILNGKSSIGRLGLSIHVTAGTGDVGFRGHWTMELFVIKPLRVYAGMAIGQLLWFTINEEPDVPYGLKKSAKYNNHDPLPQASKMHQEQPSAQSEE